MSNVKGDGLFKIRGNKIYVHGTFNGVFYRKSTNKKVTPATKQWMKKANPLDVLAEILEKDKPVNGVKSDLESFGYMVLNITSAKRKKTSQDELLGIFKNRILPIFKNYRMEDIKPLDIVNFLENQKKEVNNDRVRRIKNTLALILDYALDNDIISKNPAKAKTVSLVDLEYIPQTTEAYDTDEIGLILANAKGWLKIFLDLSFKIGLRSGETMALKWSDFNLETGGLKLCRSISKGVITEQVAKTNSTKNHYRFIQLFPDSLKLLKAYFDVRPSDEWLFINKDSRYFRESKTIIDYHFKPLLKKIGVKYKTLYATRRSYASVMSFAGESLSAIQEIMGHSQGSKITEKHYIDSRILKVEHNQSTAQRQEDMFNLMIDNKVEID